MIERFETRYAPGLGVRYAVRAAIVGVVLAVVGVAVTWGTFAGNPQWWVLALLIPIFGVPVLVSIAVAVEAPRKWGAEGRLAVRFDAEGLTLPRVGLLAWDEITALRIVDTGGVHGSVWMRAWENLTGASANRFVTVWVQDADAVDARTGGAARGSRNLHPLDGHHGYDGVWGDGLRSPGWEETAAALAWAARQRGIPVHGRDADPMDDLFDRRDRAG